MKNNLSDNINFYIDLHNNQCKKLLSKLQLIQSISVFSTASFILFKIFDFNQSLLEVIFNSMGLFVVLSVFYMVYICDLHDKQEYASELWSRLLGKVSTNIKFDDKTTITNNEFEYNYNDILNYSKRIINRKMIRESKINNINNRDLDNVLKELANVN